MVHTNVAAVLQPLWVPTHSCEAITHKENHFPIATLPLPVISTSHGVSFPWPLISLLLPQWVSLSEKETITWRLMNCVPSPGQHKKTSSGIVFFKTGEQLLLSWTIDNYENRNENKIFTSGIKMYNINTEAILISYWKSAVVIVQSSYFYPVRRAGSGPDMRFEFVTCVS